MRIASTGIIKGCVQRDQVHNGYCTIGSCFNRFFLTLVANKKLAALVQG